MTTKSLTILVLLMAAGVAAASTAPQSQSDNQRPDLLANIGIDQKPGDRVPADLVFRDETGRQVKLGDYYGDKPVVLALVYYRCPMLCTLVLNDLLRSLKTLSLDVGKDFTVVTVSFDPEEGPELAAPKKQQYLSQYNRDGAAGGWHFLTGEEASIRALTDAVGFRYAWDEKSQQYVHPSGLTILTPDGTIARYFFGIAYVPKDLRLSLVEASGNKVGSITDQIMLYCFHYDESTGRYGLVVRNLLRIGGTLTVLALGLFVLLMFRRERRAGLHPTTDK